MAEWSNAHAWKACIQKCIKGSNPFLSATLLFVVLVTSSCRNFSNFSNNTKFRTKQNQQQVENKIKKQQQQKQITQESNQQNKIQQSQSMQQNQENVTAQPQNSFGLLLNFLEKEYMEQSQIYSQNKLVSDAYLFEKKASMAKSGTNVLPSDPNYYNVLSGQKLDVAKHARVSLDAVRMNEKFISQVPDQVAKLQVMYDCMLIDLRDKVMSKNTCTSKFYALLSNFSTIQVLQEHQKTMENEHDEVKKDEKKDSFKRESFTLYFETGKEDIGLSSSFTISKIVEFANSYKTYEITILGFSDKFGNKKKNFDLSERRAKNIKSILLNKGLNGESISIQNFGSEYLAVQTSQNQDEAFNRRVIVEILGKNY